MPTLNAVAVTTEPVSATTGGMLLYWDNAAQNNVWNTTDGNWHSEGKSNGSSVFEPGNTAVFRTGFNGTLAEDITAGGVVVETYNNDWILSGAKTLTLFGDFVFADMWEARGSRLDSRLSGAGGFVLKRGAFNLANPANDHGGGTAVRGGVLNAAGVGTGALTLGSGGVETSVARVNLDTAGNVPLALAGGMNSAVLALSGNAAFTELAQSDGATLQIHDNDFAVAIGGTSGLLPPYVVSGFNNGRYYESVGGDLQVADARDYPGEFFTDTTLGSNHVAKVAQFNKDFDLGGHTLTLGGAIATDCHWDNWNARVNVHNGTLHLPGDEAYFYVNRQRDDYQANIYAALTGPARVVKFGTGNMRLYDFAGRDLTVQEGDLSLFCSDPAATSGRLSGSGQISKDGSAPLTINNPEPIMLNSLWINDGELVVDGGEGRVNSLVINATGHLTLLNGARLTGATHFNWAGKPGASYITLAPGTLLEAAYFYPGSRGGGYDNNNTLVVRSADPEIHGGVLDMKGAPIDPGHWYSRGNNNIIFDNVTLLNTRLGDFYGANHACNFIFTNGAVGRVSALQMTDEGSNMRWQVNSGSKLYVGESIDMSRFNSHNVVIEVSGSGSELVHSGWLRMNGNVGSQSGNGIIVSDGGRFTYAGSAANSANVAVNDNGGWASNNFIRVTGNGSVFDGGGLFGIVVANGTSSSTHFAGNNFTVGNWFAVEDGALADNLPYISLADPYLWWVVHPNPQPNPSSNYVAIASGAVVNCGNVVVGNNYAFDNILRLAGGTLNASSLDMRDNNILEVRIGADGLPESRVSGVADFGANTRLRLSAAKDAPYGRFDVLTADAGITGFDNLVRESDPPEEHLRWRHGLDNGGKTLYVRRFADTTLLIVR